MRFFEAPDGHDEPTIWVEYDGREHGPVLQRCQIHHAVRHAWPHIVRALTAGPTIESARVVIDTLQAENAQLLAENREMDTLVIRQTSEIAELRRANDDLNAELTGVRRWLTDERNREGCE